MQDLAFTGDHRLNWRHENPYNLQKSFLLG